jgi:uncharacterized protein (TIGR00251 family)
MSRAEESGIREWDRLAITERTEGIRFLVQVRPRSSRSAVLGVRDTALEVALTAPPADGAANAELLKLLARVFDVRRGDVEIAVGTSSRSKVIAIYGLDAAEARARLGRARR